MLQQSIKESVKSAARQLFPQSSKYLEIEVYTFEYWRYSSALRKRYIPPKPIPLGDALYDLGFIAREAKQHPVGRQAKDLADRLIHL